LLLFQGFSVLSVKYRSRAEIVSQMLEAAKEGLEGAAKTKIMYKACLSFAQSKDYLKLLLDRGLLEYDVSARKYKLTQQGVQYLEMFYQTEKLMENTRSDN
jgi:predicted transcriptional regulator